MSQLCHFFSAGTCTKVLVLLRNPVSKPPSKDTLNIKGDFLSCDALVETRKAADKFKVMNHFFLE